MYLRKNTRKNCNLSIDKDFQWPKISSIQVIYQSKILRKMFIL